MGAGMAAAAPKGPVKVSPLLPPTIKLKDPYWVGKHSDGKYAVQKEIRVSGLGDKYVVLRLTSDAESLVLKFGCQGMAGLTSFLGWDIDNDYPATLAQYGDKARLCLHRNQRIETIEFTIECPF